MGGTLELAVVVGDAVVTHPLPESGRVSLGRSEECDLRVESPSVSRRHALLHLGPSLRIEDLGSANGTFVCEGSLGSSPDGTHPLKRLSRQSAAIGVGERVNLGAVTIVVRRAHAANAPGDAAGAVVQQNPVMRALYEQAHKAGQGLISILIQGETGVGKEVLARAVHDGSPRAKAPFLGLNCAALTESLLESELFGHERGAFTGAVTARAGLFESAEGGTVFLDEIGELPMVVQVKLLRVLEERKVMRVGGRAAKPIDVRFLSATHRDLEAAVATGAFRQDLYFRLNGIALWVPPLRERVDEIAALAERFAAMAARQLDRPRVPALSPAALRALEAHAWPGNVRELRNVVERAVVLCTGDTILPEDLPARLSLASSLVRIAPIPAPVPVPVPVPASSPPDAPDPRAKLQDEMTALDRRLILEALERCAGNQTKAATELGISRRTLISRLDAYQIVRPRKR